jgi:hypothetical protein
MPDPKAQAVGIIADGAEVHVNDRNGLWVFVQPSETSEGKTHQTDGGWMSSTALTKCRDDRQEGSQPTKK